MDRQEKRIDELLDAGLAGYSDVEPRVGLEDRILARLSGAGAEPERSAWLRWWPAWGLALAAAIALMVVISMPKQGKPVEAVKETPKTISHVGPTVAPKQMATTVAPHVIHERRTHVALTRPAEGSPLAVAKQPVFPAPSALTDQERMLFAYLRRTDSLEIAANAKPDDPPFPEKQLNQVLPVQKNADVNTNVK